MNKRLVPFWKKGSIREPGKRDTSFTIGWTLSLKSSQANQVEHETAGCHFTRHSTKP